ncbi:MAG: DUF2851 family protein, partial [Bacteroidia bacterium]|nr:DUF2851 family protein [Bacteroidia bacterium]
RIKLGDTEWAGNVEIHMKTSDWNKHGHQYDKNYSNVILHVVYEHDDALFNPGIPVTELKNTIPQTLIEKYKALLTSKSWVPCANSIAFVKPLTIDLWLERMLAERLEEKSEVMKQTLKASRNNWNETFYRHLAVNFGFKLNAGPFEILSGITPINTLARHKNSLLQIEAMLMGQAGLLAGTVTDAYFERLTREYNLLKNKFQLTPMDGKLWKFSRTRPGNFPTIRIAQFADLVFRKSHLFSTLLETRNLKQLISLFEGSASDYWSNHYKFGMTSPERKRKTLGNSSIENILINTVSPMLFLYGAEKGLQQFKDLAIGLLQKLPAEKNHITAGWEKSGIKTQNAAESQALIQLKKYYCNKFKCLSCSIGNSILNLAPENETINRNH